MSNNPRRVHIPPAWIPWITFNAFILAMLALDLGVLRRKSHEVKVKEALVWSLIWVVLALTFNAGLWAWKGKAIALQFLAGYVIEKSLSVDNLFVFVVIFTFFRVKPAHQHRILFWGILGALAMRALMIGLGAALVQRFHWVMYVFGAFLVFTGVKLAFHSEEQQNVGENLAVRLFRRVMPVTDDDRGGRFFVRENGRIFATPLVLVLLTVEMTDLVFAVDSIPAIFAVTTDTFIVYTSNVFAILGLRSLYFALASSLGLFRFLKYGLALILSFVGVKMLIMHWYKIPIGVSLVVILSVLAVSIAASLLLTARGAESGSGPAASPPLPEKAT